MSVLLILLLVGAILLWSRLSTIDERLRALERAEDERRRIATMPGQEVAEPTPVRRSPAGWRVDAERMESVPMEESDQPGVDPARAPILEESAAVRWVRDYFTGGNLVVRIGIVVLFFGVAFLLKYAAEHTQLSIEVRLIGVAVGALVLFAIGWRLRGRRPEFSLALQGGAVGVLYMTVFIAFRLYQLLPSTYAFALLAVLGVASALLALKQDSLSFAMLGAAGGFLAPVLATTGQGSHVALFSYYALLDLGIVALAWFKAWRPLNLLAFIFTFAIGTFWGVTRYIPEQFWSTEPFLVFYFLAFLAIAVLFAFQRAPQLTHYVDGTLVFGTPVIAMALQFALIRDVPFGSAFSALAAAALYLALAGWLNRLRRNQLRLLVESFLALAIALLTLAVPLALDANWNAAAWALEGAAILWMGLRQQRALPTTAGLLLQFAAGAIWIWRPSAATAAVPVLNAAFLGPLLISASGVISARLLRVRPLVRLQGEERLLSAAMLAWGLGWWLFGAGREVVTWVPDRWIVSALMGLLLATSLAAAIAAHRMKWATLHVPAFLFLPTLVCGLVVWVGTLPHPFTAGGTVVWPFGVLAGWIVLHQLEKEVPRWMENSGHRSVLWILALVAGWELYWRVGRAVPESAVWAFVSAALPAALLLAALLWPPLRARWPLRSHADCYVGSGALGLACLLMSWSLLLNWRFDGNAAPLPYMPLLNPLDIGQALVLALGVRWIVNLRKEGRLRELQSGLVCALAALVFVWLNGVLLRSMHQWLGIAYELDTLMASTLVQTALSIFWTLLALGAMLWANRSAQRAVWFAAAGLMGVVLVKLFLIDLARIGTVPRIISFLGVGALMLVIGYFSPLPPSERKVAT